MLTYARHRAGRAHSPSHGAGETISGCRNARPIRPSCWRQWPTRPTPARRSTSSARRTRPITSSRPRWRNARHDRRRSRRNQGGSGAQVQPPSADGRCPRAAIARAARRSGEATDLRYDEEVADGREGIPARERPAHDRQSRRADGEEAQSDERQAASTPSSPTWNAGGGIRARFGRFACRGQRARLHAQGDPRRQADVEYAHRDRQAEYAEPDPGAADGLHHRQPDLEGAAVDRPERIPAGGGPGSGCAGAHGGSHEARRRRGRDDDGAGRPKIRSGECASTSQPVHGVSARHPGPVPVLPHGSRRSHGCMRVQDPAKYAEVLASIARPRSSGRRRRSRACTAPASTRIRWDRGRSGST